jgi:hypothetical protein
MVSEDEDMDEDSFSEVARNYGKLVGFMLKSKQFGRKYSDLQAELRETIRAALGEDEDEGGDGAVGPRSKTRSPPLEPQPGRAHGAQLGLTQAGKILFEAGTGAVLKDVKKRFNMPQ